MTDDVTFAADPVDRYKRLVSAPGPFASDELTPNALAEVMKNHAAGERSGRLAEHVAQHSRLTVQEAKPLIDAALSAPIDVEPRATAVSQAVNAAIANADIELSDPVMLNPWVRFVCAGVLVLAVGGCILCIDHLGGKAAASSAAMVGLTVIATLALVGVLVLVMGYKNVKITGGPTK